MHTTTQPLTPKTGDVLQVIALGRISTIHQDIENIEASYRYIEDFLSRIYPGPSKIHFLGEQASGMRTDRATIRAAEDLVATGTIDLVIAEDLSRIYRNPRYQFDFVQNAVDVGTRVICIGDNLDTGDENWEITMGAAALRHGLHIPDTRRRVRRTATHSFHQGGMVQKVRYGYRKLSAEEAASGVFGPKNLRIIKLPECTPVIASMAGRVRAGESYATIADWLNVDGIAPGPYVTGGRWSARLVVELLNDPILSGMRTFRDTICRPVFKTGRHKATKNAEPETECYPQLAHLTPEEHLTVLASIAERRSERTANATGPPKRRGVPRSRSLWPGQLAVCGICGGLMYYAGRHLRCANSLRRMGERCWNRVQLPVRLARERVMDRLLLAVTDDERLRQRFVEAVWEIWERADGSRRQRRDSTQEIAQLERQAANLTAAIAAGGQLQSLVERLQTVEVALKKCRVAATKAQSACQVARDCVSRQDLADRLSEVVRKLSEGSFEFSDLLRRLIPEFVVLPIQALDTPLVRPRGRLTFRYDSLCADVVEASHGSSTWQESVTIDCFEPPLHIRAIAVCRQARLEFPERSQRKIAASLGLNAMTVKRALDYLRQMESVGLSEPYRELHAPPNQASRWRRPEQPRRRRNRDSFPAGD
ncbi:MAG: recombinase family protein [Planctomycetaceae bacterium]|nr:recombinase family protein [Planctomycetaceae bacterium]